MKMVRAQVISRMAASVFAAYGGIGLRYPAGAAEFIYKLSGEDPNEHPETINVLRAAARILRDSDGRLEIRVFPNNILGSDAQKLVQVRLGAIELGITGDAVNETTVGVAGLTSIPFAFSSHEAAWKATDGPLGTYLQAAFAKTGVFSFPKLFDAGIQQFENNTRPVRTPADLKGLKVRVAPSYIATSMFRALGTTPVALDTTETYTALQTHLVDGSAYPLPTLYDRKLYEVQKYVSLTNHVWNGARLFANADAWQKLPKNLQDICLHRFTEAAAGTGKDFVARDASIQSQLLKLNLEIDRVDVAAFKAVLSSAGVYGQWRDHYGADGWSLLEKAVGPLH